MKKKGILLLAILCCLVLVVGILAACNETASFTITFDTQGGNNIADITVGNGQVIGEVAPPTKQCARFVGFALDAGGERMWNLQTDTVSADITLYAIWEDAHTWGEWETLTEPTCTAEGAHKHICEVCGKEETENISKTEHDFIIWEYDENHHWKICSHCGAVSEKTAHVYAMTGKCECGAIVATPASEFTFTDLGNNTWRVDGYSGSDNEIVIPSRYNGGKVISIGREAFLGQLKLTSVIIPDSVTSIALYAFRNCTRLTSVSVPDSVTSIGVGAFSGCSSLESITIPFVGAEAGKTSSDTYQYPFGYIFGIDIYTGGTQVLQTYYGSSASSTTHDYYYIPSTLRNVTITGGNVLHGAFENCSMLTSVDIGSSAINIAEGAFSGCSSLESITIPFVGAEAGKTSQDTYQYPFGYIFGTTSYTGGTEVKQYYYGSSTSSTTNSTYYIPSSLREVTVTGGNILYGAFYGCSVLTSVTIGEGVTSIGRRYAFYNCTGLTEINWNAVSVADFGSSSDVFYNAGKAGNGITVTFGESVEVIPAYLFYVSDSSSRPNIKSVIIGSNVTSIRYVAFSGCSGLTSITIPDSVTSIGDRAFSDCSGLTSVTIGESVTSIGSYAFYNCTGLTSITIPNSVTSIGSGAFYGCTGLKSVYYTGDIAGWCGISGLVTIMSSGRTLYINGSKVEGAVTIPDGVTSIGSYAFYGCSGLTSITIPDSVTSIGSYAFSDCSGLTSVTIPDSVTSIGGSAFYNCSGLTSVTIPDGLTSIGSEAFLYCYKLVEVYNKSSLSITTGSTSNGYIGYYAKNVYTAEGGSRFTYTSDGYRFLYDGTKGYLIGYYGDQTELTLPDSFTAYDGTEITEYGIYDYAFAYQTGITSVSIPDSVTSIGSCAFYGCSGLTSVTIGEGVTSIGSLAFSGCRGLESITIPFVGAEAGKTSSDTYQYPFGYIFGTTFYTGGTGVTQYYYGSSTSSTTYNTYYIPSSLREVTVTGENILRGAFYNCTGLTSITIGDGVTSIGNYAFYNCSGLTSVTIGAGVTSIGDEAFYGCYKLVEVYNKSSLSITAGSTSNGYIGYYAKNVYTAEGGSRFTYTSDGYRFLYDGTKGYLIGYYGDQTELTLPDSFTAYDGTEITEYGIYDYAFRYQTSIMSVSIGNGVTSIPSYAFRDCTNLTSVTIGASVTSIGSHAFYNCTGLTSITIPDSVTSIGSSAFRGCSGLKSITIPFVGAEAGKTSSDTYQYPFGYIFGTDYYAGGTGVRQYYYGSRTSSTTSDTYYIPSSLCEVTVTGGNILYGAFYNCSGLTSVTIGDSVTSIGNYAFYYCTGLTEINWNAVSVADFGYFSNVFYNAGTAGNGITITFGESVEVMPACLFYVDNSYSSYRPNIKSVTIGSNVTSIGYSAFYGCSGLTSVTIGDGVTSIGSYAFYNCTGLTSITIPNSVTSIGSYAFRECSGLTSITIPDSVTSIGYSAFSGCTGLTSITIPDGVTSIGGRAFSSCSGLTSVTMPDSVTRIGYSAFSGCTGLTSITIPNSVTSIGNSAFWNCTGLTSVYYAGDIAGWCGISGLGTIMSSGRTLYIDGSKVEGAIAIPDGVTSIPSYAFAYQTGITSVTIPDSVTSIGSCAFEDCTGLTSVAIGDGVTSIGSYAFSGCTKLTAITIPDSVTSIGGSAFSGCTKLTSITIPDGVTSIGGSAFEDCSGLTSVTIPDSVTSIGSYAFYGCSGLTSVTFEETSGWFVSTSSSATSGTNISAGSLSDKSTAAEYLTDTYYNYYWKRNA